MAEQAARQLTEEELAELSVRCLVLRLAGETLILPNTLVAEVSDTTSVNVLPNAPEWLSGFINWRGRNVPLVSFERLLGLAKQEPDEESRMVVLNTLNGNPRMPFIAMEIRGLPHLSLLKQEMVAYDEGETEEKPVVLARLLVEGESMMVPNIDTLERMLEGMGIGA